MINYLVKANKTK